MHQQVNSTFFRACLLCLVLSTGNTPVVGQRYQDFITNTPLKENEVLIIGFMGGRESWDNDQRGVRKLALRLRAMNLPGVHVETVENRKRKLALELINIAFDRDRNGMLDKHERTSARLIIYGQSFGGAAVVKLARQLKEIDLPVMLTIQVDSVGRGDKKIPSNVRRAANLFQRNGLFIKGEREIRPEDPSKTTIIGNFRFDYNGKRIDLSEVSWVKRLFHTAHTQMDHDPKVWSLVEKLILDVELCDPSVCSLFVAGTLACSPFQACGQCAALRLQTFPKLKNTASSALCKDRPDDYVFVTDEDEGFGQVLVNWPKQPATALAVSLELIGGAQGDRTPDLRIAN